LVAAGKTPIPLVLPDAVFNSTRLLSLDNTPISKSVAVPVAYPFPLVSFNLNELLEPWIHIPPHGLSAEPFLTDTYSPDLNPIEQAFAKLKAFLRAARPRTFDHVHALVAAALVLFTPAERRNYIRHCCYHLTVQL
jgi:hypothetical protein